MTKQGDERMNTYPAQSQSKLVFHSVALYSAIKSAVDFTSESMINDKIVTHRYETEFIGGQWICFVYEGKSATPLFRAWIDN